MNIETWLQKPLMDEIAILPTKILAIDVGANVGSWTVSLCDLFRSVIAIEPDNRAYKSIPARENLTIITKAVSNNADTKTLFYRPESGHNSLSEIHPIGNGPGTSIPYIESKEIECITLDSIIIDTKADFVKIDIEGAEVLALQGCKNLSNWKDTLFIIECHDTYDEVYQELIRLDKNIAKIEHPLTGAHPGHCWVIGKPQ